MPERVEQDDVDEDDNGRRRQYKEVEAGKSGTKSR
jgi:hypothetical protein